MRKKLRRPFPMNNTGRTGEASSARATRGAPGASTMDPTPARGPGSRSSPFRMQKDSGSRAAAPPAGKFPMRPKRVRRARRSIGSGAGDRRVRRIGWKAREASGCDRPRLRVLMRMRGTRDARYLQTLPQIYPYAAYPTQLYSYAEYATAEYAYADIT